MGAIAQTMATEMARLGQAVALTVVAVACGTPSDPGGTPGDPEFDLITETARSEFSLEETFVTIPFTVTNVSAGTIYYLNICGPRLNVEIDRHEGGRWVVLYGGICIAILQSGPHLSLHPGQGFPSMVAIRESGVYRLRLGVSTGSGRQTDWSLTSNTFVVR